MTDDKRGLNREVASEDVVIGTAQAAQLHGYQDGIRLERGPWPLLDPDVAWTVEDGGKHQA